MAEEDEARRRKAEIDATIKKEEKAAVPVQAGSPAAKDEALSEAVAQAAHATAILLRAAEASVRRLVPRSFGSTVPSLLVWPSGCVCAAQASPGTTPGFEPGPLWFQECIGPHTHYH